MIRSNISVRHHQFAHFKRTVLSQREPEPSRHLNLAEPEPLTGGGQMLNQDGEHGPG